MKNIFFHKSLLLFILVFSFSIFSTFIQAAPQNTDNSKKQIVVSLRQKAKKALLSGNKKQADVYWQQANSVDSQNNKPIWLQKGINNSNNANQLAILDEKKFIQLLIEMPYEKAKIELDKRLLFSPNNTKLRLVYLDLARKNNDEIEIERQSKLLGIKQPQTFDYKLLFKYILAIAITLLILYEILKIFKQSKK